MPPVSPLIAGTGAPIPLRVVPGERTVTSTCSANCGGSCILHLAVRDGTVTGVRAGAEARPCVKGLAQWQKIHHPDRLTRPLRRIGERGEGRFVPIGWDEALDEIAGRIRDTQAAFGPEAVLNAPYSGSQTFLNSRMGLDYRLLNVLGGQTLTAGSLCTGAAIWATRVTYGRDSAANAMADLINARLVIVWGWNPAETTFAAGSMAHLLEARAAGAQIVAIDPRYSDTAAKADEWIAPRPGTDTALALALAQAIIAGGLHDTAYIAAHVHGFDRFAQHVRDLTPEWAAPITGVPAAVIRSLARRYATMRPAAIKAGSGLQRTANGDQVFRALPALAAITGNVGVAGGDPAGYTSSNPYGIGTDLSARDRATKLCRIPVNRMADAILRGTAGGYESDVRIAFIYQSNAVNQLGNVHRTEAALRSLDFLVTADLFLTPTARFADIVLPAASEFEQEDVTGSRGHGYLIYMPKVVDPPGEARSDLDVWAALSERLGVAELFGAGRSRADWIREVLAASPDPDVRAMSYEQLRDDGIARFPPAPPRIDFADGKFPTPSGKIELYSDALAADGYHPLPTYVEPWEMPGSDPLAATYPLQLVSPHSRLRAHSQYAQLATLAARNRAEVWLNRDDATERGIGDGDAVRIYNDRGTLLLPALVTDRIRPGVVAIYQGQWYDPDNPERSGCANVLTRDGETPRGQSSTYNTCLVQVAPVAPPTGHIFCNP